MPDPGETVVRTLDSQRVRDAVARLPVAQRRALELAYFRGRTYRQVAVGAGHPRRHRQLGSAGAAGPQPDAARGDE